MQGKVKWFSSEKGYGFIEGPDDPDEIFVHFNDVEGDGERLLVADEQVEYELSQDRTGRTHAANVKVVPA
jgi:CspA family cold shock protein